MTPNQFAVDTVAASFLSVLVVGVATLCVLLAW